MNYLELLNSAAWWTHHKAVRDRLGIEAVRCWQPWLHALSCNSCAWQGTCSHWVAGGLLQNLPAHLDNGISSAGEPLTAARKSWLQWGTPTSHGSCLNYKGSTSLIRGRIFLQGSERTDCFGVLGLGIWKGFKLLPLLFCHQRARLPALPGEASACKDKGTTCCRSLMSFFSHLPYTCISHFWLDLKPCLRRKSPKNFRRGGRDGSRLSLSMAWESLWHVEPIQKQLCQHAPFLVSALPRLRCAPDLRSSHSPASEPLGHQPKPGHTRGRLPAALDLWEASWVVNHMLTPPSQPFQNYKMQGRE